MRSNRVFWSTLTKSASQFLRSSSRALSSFFSPRASTCFLQYSMTFERIVLVTFGNGITVSAQSSSTMCLIVCDSRATVSSTSKVSPSELLRVIFFPTPADDIMLVAFGNFRVIEKSWKRWWLIRKRQQG